MGPFAGAETNAELQAAGAEFIDKIEEIMVRRKAPGWDQGHPGIIQGAAQSLLNGMIIRLADHQPSSLHICNAFCHALACVVMQCPNRNAAIADLANLIARHAMQIHQDMTPPTGSKN